MERKTWHWLNTVLYGEANRCRLPLLPITENVFGGNGIQLLYVFFLFKQLIIKQINDGYFKMAH